MIGRRRESGSAWYGQLVGSIAAGLSKRPKITVETLILLVALYFLMATNAAFWNALAATGVLEARGGGPSWLHWQLPSSVLTPRCYPYSSIDGSLSRC